jgi:hypothetical protein
MGCCCKSIANATDIIDYNLHNETDTFTLALAPTVDTYTFDAVAGHTIAIGEIVNIEEDGRTYKATVLNVVVNTITVDSPFDYPFTTAAVCNNGTDQMNVVGAPTVYHISPPPGRDITRIIFAIVDSGAMDDTLFGSGAALTNGIVLRVKRADGTFWNIFNAKTNGDFGLEAFDIEYSVKAGAGNDGFRCRRTFGSLGKNGAVIRLDGNGDEELQIVINDDLTGLISFQANAQGYEFINS